MPNLVPGIVDVFYAADAHCRYQAFKHPIQDPGGNPCLIWRHGGGWNTKDLRLTWTADGNGNHIAAYCVQNKLQATDTHFTIISIETRQAAWGSPVGNGSGISSYDEPTTYPAYFPEAWEDYKRAIVAIKANHAALGIDPEKIIVGGSSSGALMAFWSQVTAPIFGDERTSVDLRSVRTLGGDGGWDSRACGVVGHLMPGDFRKNAAGVETIAASLWVDLFGITTTATTEATALTAAMRGAVSPIAYVDAGETKWLPPVYVMYLGNSIVAQGATYTAAGSAFTFTSTGTFTLLQIGQGAPLQTGDRVLVTGASIAPQTLTIATTADANTITTSTGLVFSAAKFTGASYSDLGVAATTAELARPAHSIFKRGAFVGTNVAIKGSKVSITGGTAMTTGEYVVLSKQSDDLITLTATAGADAVDVAGSVAPHGGSITAGFNLRVLKSQPYQDAHDDQQFAALAAAFQRRGIPMGGLIYGGWADSAPQARDAVSEGLYRFMVSTLSGVKRGGRSPFAVGV